MIFLTALLKYSPSALVLSFVVRFLSGRRGLIPLSLYPGFLLLAGGVCLYLLGLIPVQALGYAVAASVLLLFACSRARRDGEKSMLLGASFLSALGLVFLYRIDVSFGLRQSSWLLLGLVGFFLARRVPGDYRALFHYRYLAATLGLILLLLPVVCGKEVGGARSWVAFGSFRFQPSEFAKLLFTVFLAGYLEENREVLGRARGLPKGVYYGPLAGLCGLSLVLLVLQKDLGVCLVFFLTFLLVVGVATRRPLYFLAGAVAFAAGSLFVLLLFPHVRLRLAVYLDPWAHARAGGYQIVQALLALGEGALLGWGLGSGFPGLIPAVHTDFLLALVGEEMGLIGTGAIVLLYLFFFRRALEVAAGARDDLGCLLALGATSFLFFQTVLILGGVTGLLPLTGLTLPFLSYGGSSLVTSYVFLGLLEKIGAGEMRVAQERG